MVVVSVGSAVTAALFAGFVVEVIAGSGGDNDGDGPVSAEWLDIVVLLVPRKPMATPQFALFAVGGGGGGGGRGTVPRAGESAERIHRMTLVAFCPSFRLSLRLLQV